MVLFYKVQLLLLKASTDLRSLRDLDLLSANGKGKLTYYTAGPKLPKVGVEILPGGKISILDNDVPIQDKGQSIQDKESNIQDKPSDILIVLMPLPLVSARFVSWKIAAINGFLWFDPGSPS